MSDPVLEQYEAYPYPARNPEDERKRLIEGSPSHLAEVNHYLFAGRLDSFRGFRALVAGGGTGDGAIMLAQHLIDFARERGNGGAGEVVYLDTSRAARRIAEARARERDLANVTFRTGSLLELSALGLGNFDYIDCCGVLHHLEDPAAGLRALSNALNEKGGIGLMVYAPDGRNGVYQVQEIMRGLASALPLAERVEVARRLLDALPPTNWFKRNPHLGDHKRTDAELVDLILHARDRAYRVDELLALVSGAGLRPVAFIEPVRYEPATYINDGDLLRRIGDLDWTARAVLAENLAGNLKKHVLYAAKTSARAKTVARPDDAAAVPVLRELGGADLARALSVDSILKVNLDGLKLRRALPRLAPPILARIDGKTSLGEIHAALRDRDPSLEWPAFKVSFDRIYDILSGLNHLLIRNPG